ncbi:MAG: hypothetical protein JXA77_00545 [Bacteroidales bacterium]|nr:hypothetical protein [Bacteroidales bacterium]MBN2817662.1 hypothetical protein [Bacteroidales bacterium]
MKTKKLNKRIGIAILLFTAFTYSFGQTYTTYYMQAVPQAYHYNPASQPACGFHFGLPAYNNITISNTLISPSDLLLVDPESGQTITLLHPNADAGAGLENYVEGLRDIEELSVESTNNILSFGFRVKSMYFSFDATLQAKESLSLPKDFLEFMLVGWGNNETHDFTDLNINMSNYIELGVTVSKEFFNTLSIGVRPKMLLGLASISTNHSVAEVYTSNEIMSFDINSDLRMGASGLTIPLDSLGMIDFGGLELDPNLPDSPLDLFNKGLGIDLGAHLNIYDKIQLSFSALDLGYIKWDKNARVTNINGSFSFEGVELKTNNDDDTVGFADRMVDSLKENLKFSSTSSPFTTRLDPKIIAGGRIFLTPGLSVGLLSVTEIEQTRTTQDFILLGNLHPRKGFSLSASYSLFGKSHKSFGLGMGTRVGPFNTFWAFDYIPMQVDKLTSESLDKIPLIHGIPIPVDMYKINFRFGGNFVFGCRKQKKLSRDLPLYQSTDWQY